MVQILPHWNWQGHEGQNIPVMAYTNAEAVELFLNGKSLGSKKRFSEPVDIPVGPNVSSDKNFVTKYRLEWQLPPHPATLKTPSHSSRKHSTEKTNTTPPAPQKTQIIHPPPPLLPTTATHQS